MSPDLLSKEEIEGMYERLSPTARHLLAEMDDASLQHYRRYDSDRGHDKTLFHAMCAAEERLTAYLLHLEANQKDAPADAFNLAEYWRLRSAAAEHRLVAVGRALGAVERALFERVATEPPSRILIPRPQ